MPRDDSNSPLDGAEAATLFAELEADIAEFGGFLMMRASEDGERFHPERAMFNAGSYEGRVSISLTIEGQIWVLRIDDLFSALGFALSNGDIDVE